MKLAHQIIISVFAKEDENKEAIKKALISLIPFNLEKEKIQLNEQNASGFSQKQINILEVILKKDRHINEFLKQLNKNLQNQKQILLNQINTRLDNELKFFMRLDKSRLLNNEFLLIDRGDCFHIKISIAAFPATKINTIGVIKQIFK